MAPATRREARLSASLHEQATNSNPGIPGAGLQDGRGGESAGSVGRTSSFVLPNVEHILENFEAFKRKHIAQNREVIKTNALAQMRIRELETKIEALESEREAQALSSIGLRAKVNRLEHVVECVQTGWDVIGRSLATINGSLRNSDPSGQFEGLGLDMSSVGPEPHLRSGNRINLGSSALPAGVVRSVARAPDPHLVDLMEGEGEEEEQQQQQHGIQHEAAAVGRVSYRAPRQQRADWLLNRQDTPMLGGGNGFEGTRGDGGFHTIQRDSLFDVGGPPSPMSSPGLPMDLEDAIAAASRDGSTPEWRPNPPSFADEGGDDAVPPMVAIRQADLDADIQVALRAQHEERGHASRRTARRSSRRQSGLLSPPNLTEDGGEDEAADKRGQGGAARSANEHNDDVVVAQADASSHVTGLYDDAGNEGDSTVVSPPLPLDQRAIAGPILSAGLMTTSSILREVTNGVKHTPEQRREDAVEIKGGFLQPMRRKARRQKMEPALVSKKASLEDLGPREPSTPGGGGTKRKMTSHDAEACHTPPSSRKLPVSPSLASDTSTGAAAGPANGPSMASEADAAFGRTRRTRKSVNYALPKLNTKMRKPDPVDLIPATPGSSAPSSRHATPSSLSLSSIRRAGNSGNLHDLRKQREAAASRDSDDDGDGRPSTRRSGPDDEDGNVEGGSASLADLFETNPPRPRSTRKRTSQQAIGDGSEEASSTKRFWRTESNTDTSDDESRALSVSDVGDMDELETAMGALSTLENHENHLDTDSRDGRDDDDDDEDYQPSGSGGMTKSGSSGSIQSSSSAEELGIEGGRRPSLRRPSTTLPPRAASASSLAATNSLGLTTSSSSDAIAADSDRTPKEAPGSSAQMSRRSPPDASQNTTPTQASSSRPVESSDGASTSAAVAAVKPPPTRTVTTRRLSAARLTAVTVKTGERPKSAGNSAPTSRPRSSSTNLSSLPSSSSSPTTATASGSSSLGKASGNNTAGLQRGGLHAALTNQPRSAGLAGGGGSSTPQMRTKSLPSTNSPVLRSSPLLGTVKVLRPSASTSSLATATTSSGRSSPALSITSSNSNSSSSHTSVAVRPASASSTSALARTTTMKQASTIAAAAAQSAAAGAAPSATAAAVTGVGTAGVSAGLPPSSAARTSATKPGPNPSRSMPSLKRAAVSDATPRSGARALSSSQVATAPRTVSSGQPLSSAPPTGAAAATATPSSSSLTSSST